MSLAETLYPDADRRAAPTAAGTAYHGQYVEGLGTTLEKPSQGGALSRLRRGLARWVAAVRERRAVIDQLSTMSDRDLDDIGLSRAQIHQVFDPAFARARDTARRVASDPDERVLAEPGPSRTPPRPTAGD